MKTRYQAATSAAIGLAIAGTSPAANAQETGDRPSDRPSSPAAEPPRTEPSAQEREQERREQERREQERRDQQRREEEQRRKGETGGRDVTGKNVRTTAADIGEGAANAFREAERATAQPGPFRPLSATWNPVGLFVERLSFNVEWAPITHHVVIASPHFANASADIATAPNTLQRRTFAGAGAELGYRYYTGLQGANGIFLGPSFLFGFCNASIMNESQAFSNVGFAIDAGIQDIFFDRLVLGAGVGIAYVSVNREFGDLPMSAASIATGEIKPRLLASAGMAF